MNASFLKHFRFLALAAALGCGEIDIRALSKSVSSAGIYLEAESGQLSDGFTIGSDPSASGGRFIQPLAGASPMDVPGSARAVYQANIPKADRYSVWGRFQSPDIPHNRFWARVDDGTWYLWYFTTGEAWYWNRVHDKTDYYSPPTFELSAGTHEIVIANATDGVRLDRLYLTAGSERPVGDDTRCRPPDSIEVDGGCIPSCGSLGGNQCGDNPCMGARIVTTPVYDCKVCCIVPR